MRSFLYEFLNRIKAKNAVIFTIILTVLVSFFVIGNSFSIYASSPNSPQARISYYHISGAMFNDNGTYHFDTLVFNDCGEMLGGYPVNYTLREISGTNEKFIYFTHETNAAGFSNITLTNVTSPSSQVCAYVNGDLENFNPYAKRVAYYFSQALPYGSSSLNIISLDKVYLLKNPTIIAVDFNANGIPEGKLSVYYNYSCNVSGFVPLAKSSIPAFSFTNFTVVEFNPSISERLYYTNVLFAYNDKQIENYVTLTANSTPNGKIVSSYSGAYIYLILLMGVLGISLGYFSYNKDRISGSYQELLVRPNSRIGLMTSRFLAVSTFLLVSSSVLGLSIYFFLMAVYSYNASNIFILYVVFSSFVVSDAMAAISFLIGTKKSSAVAVISYPILILFISLLVLPVIVPDILGELHVAVGSNAYNLAVLLVSVFSPTSSVSILGSALFKPILKNTVMFISAAVIWISVLYCFMWIVVPYMGNYLLSKNTD